MNTIKLDTLDNVIVALEDLKQNDTFKNNTEEILIKDEIPAKHKFFTEDLNKGDNIIMYGVKVGQASKNITKGERMTTENSLHATDKYQYSGYKSNWKPLDVSKFENKFFLGYHREDGRVGTANYWLFVPTVFCENRNIEVIKEALIENLGYSKPKAYQDYVKSLVQAYENASDIDNLDLSPASYQDNRLFKNIDGIKFLTHQGGCGGTRQDAVSLGKLLASYIDHPNVAGVSILGLGCENLQMNDLLNEIKTRNPNFTKPIIQLEQQKIGTETELIQNCIQETFKALIKANAIERKPATLDNLVLGVKCGGSDGFSGISANPAVGYAADLLVSLGGSVLLAEFPELCGAEQQLLDRMKEQNHADKFITLMEKYSDSAEQAGSGFHMNPSPGNIRDGLITDSMKSNGAAKKGGTSPIVDVLEYTQSIKHKGLNLVCTPGNDVEATTGKVASGATVLMFTTGLGTPTGNPICPTIKVATNNKLTEHMSDIIDFNTGAIIDGTKTIEQVGEELLEHCILVASGIITPKAVLLQQDDFIPWKRGISL